MAEGSRGRWDVGHSVRPSWWWEPREKSKLGETARNRRSEGRARSRILLQATETTTCSFRSEFLRWAASSPVRLASRRIINGWGRPWRNYELEFRAAWWQRWGGAWEKIMRSIGIIWTRRRGRLRMASDGVVNAHGQVTCMIQGTFKWGLIVWMEPWLIRE
jgi:hypothetical protein